MKKVGIARLFPLKYSDNEAWNQWLGTHREGRHGGFHKTYHSPQCRTYTGSYTWLRPSRANSDMSRGTGNISAHRCYIITKWAGNQGMTFIKRNLGQNLRQVSMHAPATSSRPRRESGGRPKSILRCVSFTPIVWSPGWFRHPSWRDICYRTHRVHTSSYWPSHHNMGPSCGLCPRSNGSIMSPKSSTFRKCQ